MRNYSLTTILGALILFFAYSTTCYAQNILDGLTFEVPEKLMRPTGVAVNVRERPAVNAPKYKTEEGWDMTVTKHHLYAVNTELPAWWAVEGGYVSKKVAKLSVGKPITDDMLNRFFGWCESYDSADEWIVSPTASRHGLVVCMENSGWTSMWLGKQEGNVFVFKYRIFCTINADENNANPNLFDLHKEDRDGMTMYEITIGKNFIQEVPWGGMGTTKTLNFKKLNDKVLEHLFKEAIEKWTWRDSYFYLNSDLLSGEYTNYVLG